MFKKILLAITPTEACQRAADMGFALARQGDAELTIFHSCGLLEDGWGSVRQLLPSGKVDEIKNEIDTFYKKLLETYNIQNYKIEVTPGLPDSEILRYARKSHSDLILLGSHAKKDDLKRSKVWGMAGSTLEKVSQKARCPVMIVTEEVPRVWTSLNLQDRKDFNVLVVDDELSLRDSVKEWLDEEGYSAAMAASGAEALQKLAQEPFHLMITDIKMAEMDGVELLKRAKKTFPELEVIMMTAYATVDTAVDSMKTGSYDYLTKPFEPDALIDKVNAIYARFEDIRAVKVGFSNIVMATDFSKPADCAFDFASRIAQFYGARMHIFHALDAEREDDLANASQSGIERNINEALSRMKKRYGDELDNIIEYSLESWEGAPYREILKFARWRNADLIIMAHHSKIKDPEKAFLGSTVVQTALAARCPTMSINRDFVPICDVA